MKSKSQSSAAFAPALSEPQAVLALTAIAQTQRLRVFRALVQAGAQGLTPGALALLLDVAGSTLSFHLKELAHSELVTVEQQGRSLIYRANYAHMNALMTYLTENCCAAGGAADCC
jgi:ArsR family transcriptional regulator, arsenate/arsenite/antimonite-responsive transcriptional repressor